MGLLILLPGLASGQASLSARVLDPEGDPVEDAVVSLRPLDREMVMPERTAEPIEIVQQGMEYRPRVTPVLVGSLVRFPNRDDVQHHLYSVSRPKKFEKPLYAPGALETVEFDQPGVVLLGCNIHDWMSAHVVVLETPHFAKSDAAGQAVVPELPAGRYTVTVWHARLPKPLERELTLPASGELKESFSLALRPDRRARRAPSPDRPGY